jgi:HEAT repeat protein
VADEPAARAALQHARPDVRATALGALARMQKLTDADVAAGLIDIAPVVRRRSCELAVPYDLDLVPALDDDNDMVVEAAAWALGERSERADAADVAALAAVATGHDEPLCREAAVAALGAIGDDAGLPAILAATTDKPAIRRRAVLALAPFDGNDVHAALTRALEDRDWQVRQAAEDLLAE